MSKHRYLQKSRELLRKQLVILTIDQQFRFNIERDDISGLTFDLKQETWTFLGNTYMIGCKRTLTDTIVGITVVGVYDRSNINHLRALLATAFSFGPRASLTFTVGGTDADRGEDE